MDGGLLCGLIVLVVFSVAIYAGGWAIEKLYHLSTQPREVRQRIQPPDVANRVRAPPGSSNTAPARPRARVRPSAPGPQASAEAPAVTIRPRPRALWQRKHWRQDGNRLLGAYRTRHDAWVGEVVLNDNAPPDFYILNPPPALLAGPHGSCFRARGADGRFWIHFSRPQPGDPDGGIAAVEDLLRQALESEVA